MLRLVVLGIFMIWSWFNLSVSFSALFTLSTIFYYYVNLNKPKLTFKKTEENEKILKSCGRLQNIYYPPFYLLNAHLHTVLADLIFRSHEKEIVFEREIIKDEDGGSIALDWIKSEEISSKSHVLIVYPGVTGSSAGNYVQQIGMHFKKLKFRVCCVNHRGINSELTV
jgi:predicted alpha/beta-fold hydrolase